MILPTNNKGNKNMASTTTTFLKSRVSKPTVGKWSSGFSACKKYADEHKIPLIGVWSNGDACGHCTNFENSCMQSAFTSWQKTSGCVFWFGCSSDKTADDKYEGTGFTWARNNKLSMYPFVRVWWKAGKVDVAKSGDSWTGGTAKGGATFVKNLKSTLKNFNPNASTDTGTNSGTADKPVDETTKPDTGCTDGDCNAGSTDCGDCGDCGDCTEKLADAVKTLTAVSSKCADAQAQISVIQSEVNALIEALSK